MIDNNKRGLYKECQKIVTERLQRAKEGMEIAQKAANQETKSSAGDKYETGRALMQIEKDNSARLLAEAMKLEKILHLINPEKECKVVELGSLVLTNGGNFYLAIGLGKLILDDAVYFVISPVSPIGQSFLGKQAGESLSFNGKNYSIIEVQ